MISKHDRSRNDPDLRRRAEEIDQRGTAQSLEDMDGLSAEEIRRKFHQLRVHQIELEMQNEELRRMHIELDATRARYFDLYDIAPVGYVTISKQGLIRKANIKAASILGLTRSALISKRLSRFILSGDENVYYRHLKHLFESSEPQSCELRMVQSDGTVFCAYLSATLAQDKSGDPLGLITLTDITERKRSEVALIESEEKFRAIFNNSEDGVLFTAPDGHIFSANKAACEMFEFSEQELCHGGRDLVVDTTDPMWAQALEERKRTGRFQGELNYKRRNGTLFPVELSSTIFPFRNGEERSCIIFRDITERVRIAKELQNSLAEREVLLREVHHRVKNNMASIIGLLNLQQSAVVDPQTKMIIADLGARIHAMSLVHEKFYRSDSLSRVDFHDYLQSLILHLRTSFGLPRIFCDIAAQGVEMPLDLAVPCGMIINELIINALKYAFPKEWSGLDEARIQVAMTRDNNTFTLSVADNGIGLPPGFDLNMTNTLGLSLVQMLGQHQLGGRFEVDQTGGTRITLTFSLDKRENTYA